MNVYISLRDIVLMNSKSTPTKILSVIGVFRDAITKLKNISKSVRYSLTVFSDLPFLTQDTLGNAQRVDKFYLIAFDNHLLASSVDLICRR